MLLLDFLFIKGLNVEPFQRKTCRGFDGDFAYGTEDGYKYHLYFENISGHKYEITIYEEEDVAENNWSNATFGYMESKTIEEFPKFMYLPNKPYEPYNVEFFRDKNYITTPYFDYSKIGDDENFQRGYAKVNFDCFVPENKIDENWIKEYEKKETDYIEKFKENPESIFEKSLIDDVLSSWSTTDYMKQITQSFKFKKD